jgi:hypothetical protein
MRTNQTVKGAKKAHHLWLKRCHKLARRNFRNSLGPQFLSALKKHSRQSANFSCQTRKRLKNHSANFVGLWEKYSFVNDWAQALWRKVGRKQYNLGKYGASGYFVLRNKPLLLTFTEQLFKYG